MAPRKPPTDDSQSSTVVAICFFLALGVFAIYSQTGKFLFVNYDDNKYVYENAVVQKGITWEGIKWAFTYGEIGHWHPLTWISHMVDCQFFGTAAGGPHLVNVTLHAATTVLLFLLFRTMTGFVWRSAIVAALFAFHPLRVESVAWISERKDVLSGLFFVLTLWAYVRHIRQPSAGRYVFMLAVFALGLLSKNMIVTLPFVLLLLDWWPLQRWRLGRKVVTEKIPLFLLSAGSCIATALVSEKVEGANLYPLSLRLESGIVSYAIYVRQTFFPYHLANPYPFPVHGIPIARVASCAAFLAGTTCLVFAGRKKSPALAVGWLWFLGMLVPVSGLVQISYYSRADRYTYLPGIGLALAVTWGVADLVERWRIPKIASAAITAGVVMTLSICAHGQTACWRDGKALWTHTLAIIPDNYIAHQNFADLLRLGGNLDGAIAEYQKALDAEPENFRTMNALGNVYGMKGDTANALALFERALKVEPKFADTHANIGNVMLARHQVDAAIAQFREASEIAPNNSDYHNNLGKALGIKGDDAGAIAEYRKAVELQPGDETAHFNLGNRLLKTGNDAEAAVHFRTAVELDPNDTGARNNLGRALLLAGDAEGALQCFAATTALPPDPLMQWASIGQGFQAQNRWAEAVACFQQAAKLSGERNPNVLRSLAISHAGNGDFNRAAEVAQKALALARNGQMETLAAALEKEIKDYKSPR